MLKGILLSIILVAGAGAGKMLSNARKRRFDLLGELLAAMRVLRLRMLNSMEPLGILLRKSDSRLFRDLGNALREDFGLRECWEELRLAATRRGCMLDSLTEDDLRLLDGFFQRLGGSGREEQMELFSSTIAQLEEAQTQARKCFSDASRTYTALGALVGIAVCILIV